MKRDDTVYLQHILDAIEDLPVLQEQVAGILRQLST